MRFIALCCLLASCSVLADYFQPHSLEYDQLMDGTQFRSSEGAQQVLEEALTEHGIVTIKNIPSFSALRSQVFTLSPFGNITCSHSTLANETVLGGCGVQ